MTAYSIVFLLTGEKATATVPSYYFTKPLGKGMKTLMKTSSQEEGDDNGDVCNKSVKSTLSGDVFEDKENIRRDMVPKIRMVVKKVALKKNMNKSHTKSPWCRSGKRRYKKVVMYVDEFGNEIPPESLAEKKETDGEKREIGDVPDSEKSGGIEKAEEPQCQDQERNSSEDDCEAAEVQKDTKVQCCCRGSRSPRRKHSPGSPRTSRRLPRCEQLPVGSNERCNKTVSIGLKEDDKPKQAEDVSVSTSRQQREKSLSPDVSSRTRVFEILSLCA